jgi:hypothetical protein
MPSSFLRTLASGRIQHTGESYRSALVEVQTLPASWPIPDPAEAAQAALESEFLEIIGHCPKDRWRPRMLPFAIRWVTPRSHELVVCIHREFLPDIIRDLMPTWALEEEKEGAVCNLYGIPGLRPRIRKGKVVLSRPGLAGRIVIAGPAADWKKATLVAAELCGVSTASEN